MEGLTKQKLSKFRALLDAEKARLIQNSQESIKTDLSIEKEDLADETDLAVTELHQHFVFKMRDRERSHLNQIHAALNRIDQGTFGECGDCGDRIEPRRLEANPFTIVCISCKELQEHREKIYA
jgi:DnaK suppressor protein